MNRMKLSRAQPEIEALLPLLAPSEMRTSLGELFDSMAAARFASRYLGRVPFARPGSAAALAKCLDFRMLDRVLRQVTLARTELDDILVVNRGQLTDVFAPRSLFEARALFADGLSLVVRRAGERDAELSELGSGFERELSGVAQIQLFATPKGGRGFGWHYDAEDVFILQTAGTKEYFFRENTVNPRPPLQRSYDFSAVTRETTPIMASTLATGDWLYIPSGWWHVATAHTDSLGVSLGLLGIALPSRGSRAVSIQGNR